MKLDRIDIILAVYGGICIGIGAFSATYLHHSWLLQALFISFSAIISTLLLRFALNYWIKPITIEIELSANELFIVDSLRQIPHDTDIIDEKTEIITSDNANPDDFDTREIPPEA